MPEIMTRDQVLELLAGPAETRRFVLCTGIQGSGKSTFAKALAGRGFKRVSLDRMYKRNPLYQFDEGMMMSDYYAKLRKHLREGFNVVDDNLNATVDDRALVLKIPKAMKLDNIVIVHFDVPLERCLEWNKRRKIPAKENSLKMAYRLFVRNQPTAAEGRIIRIRPVEGDGSSWEVSRDGT